MTLGRKERKKHTVYKRDKKVHGNDELIINNT